MTSIGEALAAQLVQRGVEIVFGIPGVHTIELYRGLAASDIRHVTARHEQGAGFMADGYARVSGKPGVAFVITGPGLTNTLTAMAQARGDSVPMLVISGVNATASLGKGLGFLHELPDQQALARCVALVSERVTCAEDLTPALDRAFLPFRSGRPGPTHIEFPLDVAGQPSSEGGRPARPAPLKADDVAIAEAAKRLADAKSPVILAGGGARLASGPLRALAEALGAPVVQTVNARGIVHDHPLGVPASPSLAAVRDLIEASDVVLAVGTELGRTDYDMYATGTMPRLNGLIRIDLCAEQLTRHRADLTILGEASATLASLLDQLDRPDPAPDGPMRAAQTRDRAFEEIGPEMRRISGLLSILRDTLPGALIVGDSTEPVYAGNLYYDHDRPGGWFNAATGFGALGYGIPAAIGAALADPGAPVICLVGDGGAQFSLPEMMIAVDEDLPILFIVWNNHGYREIATAMRDAGVPVIGCDPTPPDFALTARSFGMPYRLSTPQADALKEALNAASIRTGPTMIEIRAPHPAQT